MAAVVRVIAHFIASVALAACVGGVGGDGTGSGSGSGSGSGAVDAAVDAPKLMWVDAATGSGNGLPCKNPVPIAQLPSGHHEPGKNCFTCHGQNASPSFTLAGTLYTNSTGNTAYRGATITITDSNNQTIELVTALNGNFYTTQAIAFPVLVMASSCPDAVKMNVAVAATGRACNSCHAGGPSQMHLP
jgi:hypothetical protein